MESVSLSKGGNQLGPNDLVYVGPDIGMLFSYIISKISFAFQTFVEKISKAI